MIGYLRGKVLSLLPESVLLDVNGVGYEVICSGAAFANLSGVKKGEEGEVYTYLQVSEQGIALFGFADIREKALFLRLNSVQGVGAKLAIAALSAMRPADLTEAMEADAGTPIATLNVDGGAAANDFLMQFQADLLGRELRRPANTETTSLGAAYLAGLASGFWSGTDELRGLRESDDVFRRTMEPAQVDALLAGWHDAVRRVM